MPKLAQYEKQSFETISHDRGIMACLVLLQISTPILSNFPSKIHVPFPGWASNFRKWSFKRSIFCSLLFCGIHYYGILVVIGVKIHITVYFINYLMYCSRFCQQYFVLAILKRTWSALCGMWKCFFYLVNK